MYKALAFLDSSFLHSSLSLVHYTHLQLSAYKWLGFQYEDTDVWFYLHILLIFSTWFMTLCDILYVLQHNISLFAFLHNPLP